MKIFKRLILTLILMIAIMLFTVNITKATTVEVTTDNLNFRREASTDSEIIMALQIGNKCELIAEEGNWYKVKYLGYIGYISKDYAKKEQITEPEETTPTTNTNEENPISVLRYLIISGIEKFIRDVISGIAQNFQEAVQRLLMLFFKNTLDIFYQEKFRFFLFYYSNIIPKQLPSGVFYS